MKFKDRHHEDLGIDLTPLIDVVFMLLLFFVVSTTLVKEVTKLGVSLPDANAQPLASGQKRVEIGIDAQGNYYLDGQPLSSTDPRRLKRVLASRWDKQSSSALIVVGDKAAPHQAVVAALEIAGELGISQVQIVAQARKEPRG